MRHLRSWMLHCCQSSDQSIRTANRQNVIRPCSTIALVNAEEAAGMKEISAPSHVSAATMRTPHTMGYELSSRCMYGHRHVHSQ